MQVAARRRELLHAPLERKGCARSRCVRLVQAQYGGDYRKVFGPLPAPGKLPGDASPNGSDAERAAWAAMSEGSRDGVDRVFANMGKAIAACERQGPFICSAAPRACRSPAEAAARPRRG